MNKYTTYDCIVIGGGITGSALAYELVKQKYRVLLLEKDRFNQNATTYSYGGLAYWSGTTDLMSGLFQEGIELYRQLERELEQDLEFRELDLLLTINAQDHPVEILSQYNHFSVTPELLTVESACQLEPLLNPHALSGALKLPHGHVHPLKVNAAYQAAFKRLGGEICYELVTQLLYQEKQIQGVITSSTTYYSPQTIICSGGLSRSLLQRVGISSGIYFNHSDVLKIAPQKDLKLKSIIMPARMKRFDLESRVTQPESEFLWSTNSPETIASVVDIGAVQFLDGSLYLGQVSHIITDPQAVSDARWSEEKIREGISQVLPFLGSLPVTRHQCLVAFTRDPNRPQVGKVTGWEGIFLFCGLTSTILLAPPLARHFATWLANGEDEVMKEL